MSTDDEYHRRKGGPVFHTVLLVVLGLCLVGILGAILEQLVAGASGVTVAEIVHTVKWGLPIHYWSTILAAVLVVCAAWTHTWTRLLIVTGLAMLYLMLRRDWQKRAERKTKIT
jgi:hypothetical protein